MHFRQFCALAILVTALSGCGSLRSPSGGTPPPSPISEPAGTAAPPPKPAPPPLREPMVLQGLTQGEIRALFGEPSERIDRAPGQIWIYRVSRCRVDVTFLLDVRRNEALVVDNTVSGEGAPDATKQQCLRRLKAISK